MLESYKNNWKLRESKSLFLCLGRSSMCNLNIHGTCSRTTKDVEQFSRFLDKVRAFYLLLAFLPLLHCVLLSQSRLRSGKCSFLCLRQWNPVFRLEWSCRFGSQCCSKFPLLIFSSLNFFFSTLFLFLFLSNTFFFFWFRQLLDWNNTTEFTSKFDGKKRKCSLHHFN